RARRVAPCAHVAGAPPARHRPAGGRSAHPHRRRNRPSELHPPHGRAPRHPRASRPLHRLPPPPPRPRRHRRAPPPPQHHPPPGPAHGLPPPRPVTAHVTPNRLRQVCRAGFAGRGTPPAQPTGPQSRHPPRPETKSRVAHLPWYRLVVL